MKYKFKATAVKWFDKVNGNTYHSVRIINNKTGEALCCPWTYGYGEHYRKTALLAMENAKWLPTKYRGEHSNRTMYERENNYPILWNVSYGLKRDMVSNGLEEE